jgi:hypothetical protein
MGSEGKEIHNAEVSDAALFLETVTVGKFATELQFEYEFSTKTPTKRTSSSTNLNSRAPLSRSKSFVLPAENAKNSIARSKNNINNLVIKIPDFDPQKFLEILKGKLHKVGINYRYLFFIINLLKNEGIFL